MQKPYATILTLLSGLSLLAACSSDGNLLGSALTTSSVNTATPQTVAQVPKVDPACYALQTRIDTLRKEGVTEKLEKASTGKTSTVAVKRTSLAQITELDKANAEFQAKCSTLGPRPIQNQAQVVPVQTISPASRTTASIAPPVVQQAPNQ